MAEVVDDRYIINHALARIGSGPIGAIDEDTPKARQARAVYYDRVDALLGLYEWTFAGKTYALSAIAATVVNGYDATAKKFITGWRYAFNLPGTRIGSPRKVMTDPRCPDTPLRQFMLEEGRVYADRTPLWVSVTVRVSPLLWLPAFRLAAIVAAASDFAVPITHDVNLASALREEAQGPPQAGGRGGLIGMAIAADRSAPNKAPMWSDPLTEARLR